MFLKKYEAFLQQLNTQISSGEFDMQENKEKLEKIVAIYKSLQQKDYTKAKELMAELGFVEEEKRAKKEAHIPGGAFPPPAPDAVMMKSGNTSAEVSEEIISNYRDWDIQTVHDEDNIEAFNSIEMMSAIFLKNLQEKIGTQK